MDHAEPDDAVVVLLVDDDVMVRNLSRLVLERQGYGVLTACDGEEALTLARQYPGEINLLLTDVNMPKMDGLQLCQCISKERPGIKLLVMSGLVSIGHLPFLRKPFAIADLKRRVDMLLTETLVGVSAVPMR